MHHLLPSSIVAMAISIYSGAGQHRASVAMTAVHYFFAGVLVADCNVAMAIAQCEQLANIL